jgi:RNA polymerase sigma factor (sigma-70 family)
MLARSHSTTVRVRSRGQRVNPERAREVRAAVEALPADQRRVVVLRFRLGLATGEIAKAIEGSEETVKRLTFQALTSLHQRLGSTAPDTPPCREEF